MLVSSQWVDGYQEALTYSFRPNSRGGGEVLVRAEPCTVQRQQRHERRDRRIEEKPAQPSHPKYTCRTTGDTCHNDSAVHRFGCKKKREKTLVEKKKTWRVQPKKDCAVVVCYGFGAVQFRNVAGFTHRHCHLVVFLDRKKQISLSISLCTRFFLQQNSSFPPHEGVPAVLMSGVVRVRRMSAPAKRTEK
jgi:hypothetical protein